MLLVLPLASCDDEGGDGDKSNSPAILIPGQVTFSVFCGATTAPTPVKFQVTNSGSRPLEVSSATATGGFVVTASLPDTVQPGASIVVEIKPPAAVVGTDRVGQAKRGTLTVTSNDPAGPREISLFADVKGAAPSFEDVDGKAITKIDLRSPNTDCPAPVEFRVKNGGERPLTIGEITGAYNVTLVGKEDTTIGPGESLALRVNPDMSVECSASGTVTFPLTGGTCATEITLPVTQLVNGSTTQCSCGVSESLSRR